MNPFALFPFGFLRRVSEFFLGLSKRSSWNVGTEINRFNPQNIKTLDQVHVGCDQVAGAYLFTPLIDTPVVRSLSS